MDPEIKSEIIQWRYCLLCSFCQLKNSNRVPEVCIECNWDLVHNENGEVVAIEKSNWTGRENLDISG